MQSLSCVPAGRLLVLVSFLLIAGSVLFQQDQTTPSNNAMANTTCDDPQPTVRVFSYDPLLIHIENFLSVHEQEHLMLLSTTDLERSKIRRPDGSHHISRTRSSSTKRLDIEDGVVRCIMNRAATLQGFLPLEQIERPQLTYYEQGQQFTPHFDWYADEQGRVVDREATLFAYINQSCTECGTSFPSRTIDWSQKDSRWCQFFDCHNESLVAKALARGAIYWRNVDQDGNGIPESLHAGLPVEDGFKAGLNLWTTIPK